MLGMIDTDDCDSHSENSTKYMYPSDSKDSPMWCTSERALSSSEDDDLDLLQYTKRRRRRRSRQNIRKLFTLSNSD